MMKKNIFTCLIAMLVISASATVTAKAKAQEVSAANQFDGAGSQQVPDVSVNSDAIQTTANPADATVVTVIDSNTLPPPMTASEQIVPQPPTNASGTSENVVVQPVADGTQLVSAPDASANAGVPIPASITPLSSGVAITPELTIENSTTPVEREMAQQLAFVKPDVSIGAIKSLFLTLWESDLIADARRGLNIRPSADDPALAMPLDSSGAPAVTTDAIREITLAGIAYKSKKNWIIWLNGRRVSPGSIPNEVYDLKVHKEFIELEWFDTNTNQIFPIRMRTYQRFNLDSRIFLPG